MTAGTDDLAGDAERLRTLVLEALREVVDPELGINVVDLGLVYGVHVDDGRVRVDLTMTTPACPLGEQIVGDAEERMRRIDGVAVAEVVLVWEPPWGPERMSESARATLGWET